jgi:hypothetical protein
MAYYYHYQFISPNGIFAIIKEELKSYYDTSAVDDLMFNTYLDKCLQKLGRATYVISEEVLFIEDFEARLPDNFHAVREAWMCTEVAGYPYQSANSFYSQAASSSTIQIAPMTIGGQPCTNPQCVDGCDECMPNLVQAIYKTNNSVTRTFKRDYLLKPGNISARKQCDVSYLSNWEGYSQALKSRQFTPHSSSYDSFDIRDNKFVTNFRYGIVNMVFYATEYDGGGNQLIPDNYFVKEYIEKFIKYKCFETLSNQVTDETFNQIMQKMQFYKQEADEAYIIAFTELRRQTPWDKQRRIKNTLNRLNMYELPTRSRSTWKRNM